MSAGKSVDSCDRHGKGAGVLSKRVHRFLSHKINPFFAVLAFMARRWRGLLSILLVVSGGYLIWTGFCPGSYIDDIRKWLEKNGDATLLERYDEAKDAQARSSLVVACKVYEKRYGKGAWVQHLNEDNPGDDITYLDIAELAVGISTAEKRDEFLASHAATYDACVRDRMFDLARRYGRTLKELRDKGGKDWRVASRNPFSLCVYDAVREKADLWNWYLDNSEWCDSFLLTAEPELSGGTSGGHGAALAETLEYVRTCSSLLKRFAEEIDALSKEELMAIADSANPEECKESLFASCLMFSSSYYDVLDSMAKASSGISMLEAMAVVANNNAAFGLGEEGAVDNPNKCRKAAESFMRIRDERKIVWDFAQDERGVGCIEFCEKVENYEWCEQVIGRFGEFEVVKFLDKYYGDSPELLRVATEMLYRYPELGWAILNEYCGNEQVKRLLKNPKIGWRFAPFYLKKGYDGFAVLDKDARWIDEVLEPNGNWKTLDVRWYEMLPIGGDVATVVKKWVQDRPVTAGEVAWAVVDVADTAAMAFSFGMTKVATTGAKVAVKTSVKRTARSLARKIAKDTARRMTRKMARMAVGKSAKGAVRGTGKTFARKISFLKKVSGWYGKAPGITVCGNKMVGKMTPKTTKLLDDTWGVMRKADPETWRKVYKGTKTLMWFRYVHTVQEKLPDAMQTALESFGVFVVKTARSLVAGAGEGVKTAVREAFGLSKGSDYGWLNFIIGGGLVMFGFAMFFKSGK